MLQILIPLVGIAIHAISQTLGCRLLTSLSLLKSTFFGFSIGFLSIILLELYLFTLNISLLASDRISLILTNLIIYSLLSFWYFVFITIAHTALRTRIIFEIHNSPDGISEKEIIKRYNSKDIVKKRINRLVNSGQLIIKNERYFIGKQGILWYAKFLQFMQHLVFGRTYEFKLAPDTDLKI